jgi:hypothetical protein
MSLEELMDDSWRFAEADFAFVQSSPVNLCKLALND